MMELEWVAYCLTCGKELDKAPNGAMMEAAAKRHKRDTCHTVILGTYITIVDAVLSKV